MPKEDFSHRTRALMGEAALRSWGSAKVALAGLGGVGGVVFTSLLRAGVEDFRLADPGVFDLPDLNRQWGADLSVLGRPKTAVYKDWAARVNPRAGTALYPAGVHEANIEEFITGADVYIDAIDGEKGHRVKEKAAIICRRLGIPVFSAGALGFGAIMTNFAPDGMTREEFWRAVRARSDFLFPASYLQSFFAQGMVRNFVRAAFQGTLASCSIGAAQAGLLAAGEVLAYLSRNDPLLSREIVFAPRFTVLDLWDMKLQVVDIGSTECGPE